MKVWIVSYYDHDANWCWVVCCGDDENEARRLVTELRIAGRQVHVWNMMNRSH